MLRVDHARWGQTAEDLRRLATSAPHLRTRERFLALYEVTQESCATRVAARTRRHPQTVMEWRHLYNTRGPEALAYRRTGGVVGAAQRTAAAPPLAGADPAPRWTLRRLVGWVREAFGRRCCPCSRSIGMRLELWPAFQGLAPGQIRGVCLCGVGRRRRLGERHDPLRY